MTRVLITDCDHPSIDIERETFAAAGVEVGFAACRTPKDVIAAGAGADALLVQYAPIPEGVMDALPMIRVIGRYGVGLDPIDVAAASQRGIKIVNVPDYCTDEVADHALGLILALSRGIVALDRGVRQGVWDFRLGGQLRRVSRTQLGIVGLGRIGSALAIRALALGFRVVAADPHPGHLIDGVKLVGLPELLSGSDVVSLHAPLNSETRHMIDSVALSQMKPGGYLVNTSRGGLVDQTALVAALQSGHLAGAALDVLESEPIASDDPLLHLPTVITPHAAFYSQESLDELKLRVSEGVVAALRASTEAS